MEQKRSNEIAGYYFFTKEDFDALNKEIEITCDRIKDAGKEIGRSYSEGHETDHDNFAYEQGQRDQLMWSDHVRKLILIKNKARVISPGSNQGEVRIGRLVTICDLNSSKEEVFLVGSYMVFGETQENDTPVFSYNAPLVKALIGAKEGEERDAFFGGKKHSLKIVKIE